MEDMRGVLQAGDHAPALETLRESRGSGADVMAVPDSHEDVETGVTEGEDAR